MVEGNTIVGNANGIFLAPGVQGNIFHGNVVTGNPPVQMSLDSASTNGLDIKNLADPGANAFEGNVCLTSANAPCPSVGPSLTASPNPIPVTGSAFLGATTLSWNAPDAQVIEIHIGSPDGKLFAQNGNRGSMQTGTWVPDGMIFYLQDVSGGKPLTADYTLATVVVHLQTTNTASFRLPGGPQTWAGGVAVLAISGLSFGWVWLGPAGARRKRLWLASGGTALVAGLVFGLSRTAVAQTQPSPQQTAATLDRMIEAHKGQQELAQFVFDTHGCKTCHTVGQNGKLGFTSKGQHVARPQCFFTPE